ncbi:transposase [Streptomyces niveiscabiei]|uniref:transposase n=2 Tax=Streptomyces niveiscabiei TaxID=164115 RepID=UPI003EB71624
MRSENDAPPTCQAAAATRRARNLPPSSVPADATVEDTVLHTTRQVRHLPDRRAQDKGRKRGLAVDVLGLVIAVVVAAASAHENAVGIALLDKVAADTDTAQKALVDQGFKNAVVAHGEKAGIEVEVVERNPAQSGFVPQAKRWVVERAYGILMLHRRLVRDYEHLPRSSESRVYWAMTAVILRRLTAATVPAWRTA